MRSRVASALGSLVFLVLVPGTVAGVVPYRMTRWRGQEPLLGLTAGRYAGGVLIVLGAVGLLHAFARFALEGRGTPAPVAPTETLVVSGLYRWVRNPMYVAVVSLVLGQALLLGRAVLLVYAAGLWLAFHLFVLGYEEPTLSRRYGTSYDRYRSTVNRWLPRPPRGPA